MKCQFGCGGWGASLCCPPHTPTPDETAKIIACHARALIDVFATARANGFPIEVVRDETSDQNYYGLVLVE